MCRTQETKEVQPHFPQDDDFIRTMESVFKFARCFGVPTAATGTVSLLWCSSLLFMHVGIVIGAIWKAIMTGGGWATDILIPGSIYATVAKKFLQGSVVSRISGAIFYGNALVSLLLFWRLKSAWSRVLREWFFAENVSGLTFQSDKNLRKKMFLVVSLGSVLAVLENTMNTITHVGLECPCKLDVMFQRYILTSHAFILNPTDYSLPLAITVFLLSKTATIILSFQDLVIILMSLGLASRYRRMNDYVKHIAALDSFPLDAVKLSNTESIRLQSWRRIREAFVRQAALVRRVDGELGALVLLSTSSNFYFICLQAFLGAGDTSQLIHKVYYCISITWLCARAAAVMMAAADVNVQSTQALRYLHGCPDRGYNVEMKRLQQQLSNEFVALSGMGIFYVKRSLLLEMAAAVIKYELVLLQFDNP